MFDKPCPFQLELKLAIIWSLILEFDKLSSKVGTIEIGQVLNNLNIVTLLNVKSQGGTGIKQGMIHDKPKNTGPNWLETHRQKLKLHEPHDGS